MGKNLEEEEDGWIACLATALFFLRNIDWEGKSRRRIDFSRTAAGRKGQRTRHKIFLLPREQIDLSLPLPTLLFVRKSFSLEKHMCLGSPTGLKTLEGETKQD